MIVNVSGRGDKDVEQVRRMLAAPPKAAEAKRPAEKNGRGGGR